MSKITFGNLRRLNLIMAGLHALQAGLVMALSKSFSLPITGSYLGFNKSTQSLEPASKILFHVQLPYLIAGFLLISSLAHLYIATLHNKKYELDLARGINKTRWFEYSISASLMMVAIALLVGIYDFVSLSLIFTLIAVMNLCGLVMEAANQKAKRVNWLSFKVGTLAGAAPWLAIAFTFWLSAANGAKPPTFVYWIFVSIFAFFNCFAINMFLQYKRIGPWKDYLFGERMYIYLSLVAKSALAWQVFAGTLRP